MKRPDFLEKAGIGSLALLSRPALAKAGARTRGRMVTGEQEHEHGHEDREDLKGPLVGATISFGQWDIDPPLDRFPNNSPRAANNHQLIPNEVTIKAGGAVNFVIAGFHQVLVYGNRTKPGDIIRANTISPTVQLGALPGPPLINDPVNRLYRGLDPSIFPVLPGSTPPQPLKDRVEVVRFPNPGTYLVICGVLPHFYDAASGEFVMFGYVRVLS